MATYETMRRAIEAEEAKSAEVKLSPGWLLRDVRNAAARLEPPQQDEFIKAVVKPKGLRGRPRGSKLGEPWKAAGVSKATWYRLKKKGG